MTESNPEAFPVEVQHRFKVVDSEGQAGHIGSLRVRSGWLCLEGRGQEAAAGQHQDAAKSKSLHEAHANEGHPEDATKIISGAGVGYLSYSFFTAG
ncbi:MAG TPA: hypothetical protein VLV83_02235 [Acidobacteriota bacterium]|nr:hypothetical protein [Acidobacteriota bacterium]